MRIPVQCWHWQQLVAFVGMVIERGVFALIRIIGERVWRWRELQAGLIVVSYHHDLLSVCC